MSLLKSGQIINCCHPNALITLKEYLMLMEGMDKAVIERSVEEFYYLSRATLVKDEKHLDRFDVVFAHVFKGLEMTTLESVKDIPAEWLKRLTEEFMSEEDKKMIEEMGGFEKFMEMMAERMKEAQERAQNGEGEGEDDEKRKGNGRKGVTKASGHFRTSRFRLSHAGARAHDERAGSHVALSSSG